MARLGDVCTKAASNIAQKDLEGHDGCYPIYGASGFIKNVDFYQQENPYIAVVKDGAGIGRIMKLPAKSSVIGTMQYILPNSTVDISYLASAMEHMNLSKYFTGATIPHIYFKDYQRETLPLPSLDEQRKIAAVLDTVSDLIAKRRQQLDKLDEMVKARFVELFGDPVANPRRWPLVPLKECLTTIENGKSFVCSNESRKNKWPAILKLSAVTYGKYNANENKALLDALQFVESAEVHSGDLLFTRKNTPELVGMATYVFFSPQKLMMPDLIFRLNTKNNCSKIFLWQLINHKLFRNNIQNLASGSAKSMSNISKERLLQLVIYLPPIQLQNQFAEFVEQTEKTKATISRSLEKLKTLKKALMQEYFDKEGGSIVI